MISTSSGLLYQTVIINDDDDYCLMLFSLLFLIDYISQYEHMLVSSDIFLSYLPLAHIMERVCEVAHYMVGAKIAYFSGDIPTISEDIKIIRPTILLGMDCQ